MPTLSAMIPIKGGTSAPPTIAMIIKDEPNFVCVPKSFTPKAKMVGNMIDMKKLILKIDRNHTTAENSNQAKGRCTCSIEGKELMIFDKGH